jgi:hypothetical protein
MNKSAINLILRSIVIPALCIGIFAVAGVAQTAPSQVRVTYPANGENLLSSYMTQAIGNHEITVENNSGRDAIVKVEDHYSGATYRLVFVRKNSTYTITDVRDGTFIIKFALGRDYSPDRKMFLRDLEVTKFDEPDTLRTTVTNNGYQRTTNYQSLTVTLSPVVGGNANSEKISLKDF